MVFSGKKREALAGWLEWNVMNKNNQSLFHSFSPSVLGKIIFLHLVNKKKEGSANLFGGRGGRTNETCWHMY